MSEGSLFTEFSKEDERWMREALKLAEKGRGEVSPNPMVGAVVVKRGELVGKGHHARYGGPHAEAVALADAGLRAEDATLYVNLEPCVHQGRTPPCVERIAKTRIRRVVIALKDPDRLVDGKGAEYLLRKHIKVDVGLLEAEAKELNKAYLKHRQTGMPYVVLKLASTLDGKLATERGSSQWITGEEARRYSHRLRAESDAVMVGAGTILADNPQLTVRLVPGRNPMKVILDTHLKTPPDAQVFGAGKTLIFTSRAELSGRSRYDESRVSFAAVDLDENGHLDLAEVLKELGRRQVSQLLVEGGGTLASEFLRLGLVDSLSLCINPSFLGKGLGYTDTIRCALVEERTRLEDVKVTMLGEDLRVEAKPVPRGKAHPESKEP